LVHECAFGKVREPWESVPVRQERYRILERQISWPAQVARKTPSRIAATAED